MKKGGFMKKNGKFGNWKSIKVRLLIIPLVYVLAGVLIVGGISSFLTRQSLMTEMKENGFSTSQRFVDRLEDIADDTAESLKQILNEIEKVTQLVGVITQASNDQASEISQITQGVEQVSQVVQTNSATAEESAAASEELSGQAEMLNQMVQAFILKNATVSQKSFHQNKEVSTKSIPPEPHIVLDNNEMDKY